MPAPLAPTLWTYNTTSWSLLAPGASTWVPVPSCGDAAECWLQPEQVYVPGNYTLAATLTATGYPTPLRTTHAFTKYNAPPVVVVNRNNSLVTFPHTVWTVTPVTIELNASGTYDPTLVVGAVASYVWRQKTAWPVSLSDAPTPNPVTKCTVTTTGLHVFEVTVTDVHGGVSTAVLAINVVMNLLPVSSAGGDVVVPPAAPLTTITLSAAASYSVTQSNATLAYRWTLTEGGDTTAVSLVDASAAVTNVTGLAPGQYRFTVTVTDVIGDVTSDTMTVWLPLVQLSSPSTTGDVDTTTTTVRCYIGRPCAVPITLHGIDQSSSHNALHLGGTYTDTGVSVALASVAVPVTPSSQLTQTYPQVALSTPWTVPSTLTPGDVTVFAVLQGDFPPGAAFLSSCHNVSRFGCAPATTLTLLWPYTWNMAVADACVTPTGRDCGVGVKAVSSKCVDVTGDAALAVARVLCGRFSPAPPSTQPCFTRLCGNGSYEYAATSFGPCNATCGTAGLATRVVTCVDASGTVVDDGHCAGGVAPPPATSQACTAPPCRVAAPSLTWWYTPVGDGTCSASCGGGTATRRRSCVTVDGHALILDSDCVAANATPDLPLQVPCNTGPCAAGYTWRVDGDWSTCSVACGGGVSTRAVSCRRVSDGALSLNPAVDCGSAYTGGTSRPCNTLPCVQYSYVTSSWSACDGCNGTRSRTLSCVAVETQASSSSSLSPRTVTHVANASLCALAQPTLVAAASAPTVDVEQCVCPNTCVSTTCSGHGVCNASTGGCACQAGYSGQVCEVSTSGGCAGPVDGSGVCCGAGVVLDAADRCCNGTLDSAGGCCAYSSGHTVNRCGVCGGAVDAVVSITGVCCEDGVVDAAGMCCDGVVDDFGVCDGDGRSGTLRVTMALVVTVDADAFATAVTTDVTSPLSPVWMAVNGSVTQLFNATLGTSSSTMVALTTASRRRAVAAAPSATAGSSSSATAAAVPASHHSAAPRRAVPSTPVAVEVVVAVPAAALSQAYASVSALHALLSGSALDAGNTGVGGVAVNVTGVTGVASAPVCGNGVCETGERRGTVDLDSSALSLWCPHDCPLGDAVCAATANGVCNGAGVCVADASLDPLSDGQCVCWRQRGYVGDVCGQCAPGFVPSAGGSASGSASGGSDSGGCVKLEATVPYRAPSGVTGLEIGLVAAAVVVVLGVVGVGVAMRQRRIKRAGGTAVEQQTVDTLSPLNAVMPDSKVSLGVATVK